MRGEKKQEWADKKMNIHPDWTWTYPVYTVELNVPFSYLKRIEIDPSMRLADVNRENGIWSR
jgi:hypothetical protein